MSEGTNVLNLMHKTDEYQYLWDILFVAIGLYHEVELCRLHMRVIPVNSIDFKRLKQEKRAF